ncbi:MAG: hypothetical protein ABI880_02455 [Acidobacteriota bacterium]
MVIVVLAGTPAMAAVCAALCLPGMAHTSSHHSMPVNTPSTPGAPASSHHDARAHQHAPAHTALPSDAPALNSADHNCCSSTVSLVGASGAAARAEMGTLAATEAPISAPLFAPFAQQRSAAIPHPVAPPPPARAPIVLRV